MYSGRACTLPGGVGFFFAFYTPPSLDPDDKYTVYNVVSRKSRGSFDGVFQNSVLIDGRNNYVRAANVRRRKFLRRKRSNRNSNCFNADVLLSPKTIESSRICTLHSALYSFEYDDLPTCARADRYESLTEFICLFTANYIEYYKFTH